MKRFLTLILFSCFVFSANIKAQEEVPLTLFQIEKVLKSKEVSLKERNRLLIEGVKQRGITFPMYLSTARMLMDLGASEVLLDTLQAKAPPMPSLLQSKMDKEGRNLQISNDFDIDFLLIPKGEFMMGAKENEIGSMANERPLHQVKISKNFYIGKAEVTQKQWMAVMGNNPSQNKQCGEDCPVDSVSWDEVQQFIKKLNEKDNSYFTFRLPTEAEWEYAARATTNTRYYWGDDDNEKTYRMYANADNKSPTRVGSFLPNGFGLYDMSGNVWEYVEDVWHTNYAKGKNDGSANTEGDSRDRVMKGGSFNWFLGELRSGARGKVTTTTKMSNVGFRLAADYTEPKKL
ncbi:MAG: formylglycine-generating enzyme family protein [Acidobacteriota bacterium]